MEKITHFFLKTTTGRLIILALVTIGIAYVARVYFLDLPAIEEKAARGAGADAAEAMADALEDYLSERDDTSELPALSQWYPSDLPCGAATTLAEEREPIWEILEAPVGEETSFQYRFEFGDDRFAIIARRDTDCDGIYAVWRVEGRVDFASALGRSTEAQNVNE